MHPKVDEFLANTQQWKDELTVLRNLILDCGLQEDFKWKHPCYTYNGANVVIIHGFKAYCALLFFKGALLQDSEKILVQQTEQVQAARQIRFTNVQEIHKQKSTLTAYLYEAIEVEKAGLKIDYKQTNEFDTPEEFETILQKNETLKTAFEALTPGRQRAYLLYFSAAKQSKTRIARIEKYTPLILQGKGLNDCTCGLSKKMPACDGSHKLIGARKI